MEEKQVLVRIEDLCKYFRLSSKEELKAVDHVSFDIFRNETVGIPGAAVKDLNAAVHVPAFDVMACL